MKTFIAIIMGFFSGLLLSLMSSLIFLDDPSGKAQSETFGAIVFIGGWAVSAWILRRGALSISKVFSRGFLLGAAEWLFMIMIGFIFGSKAVSDTLTSTGSEAEMADIALGGGIVALATGGVSIFMALICLLGFAVSYFIGREMKTEKATPAKKCPQCAEMIQADALKCRYCGADQSVQLEQA